MHARARGLMVGVGDTLLGKYRVERELGRGGMGHVVEARHIDLDERVAIKFLLPECARSPEVVTRFMREARAAARIRSDHVVRMSDVGRLPTGEPYMVMELLEGEDLERLVRRRGPLPIVEAVDYVMQAIEAVAAAHALGIVHRDLKPANLFLATHPDGTWSIKVLDFGISKFITDATGLTRTPGPMGSPLYMSPEQLVSAKDVDTRTDVWSLGVILHQLLTNSLPFGGDSLPQLVAAVFQQAPISLRAYRPDAPPALEAIVHRALEKARERRFANVGELADALAPFGSAGAFASAERTGRLLGPLRTPLPTAVMSPFGADTASSWAATPAPFEEPPAKSTRTPLFVGLGVGAVVVAVVAVIAVFARPGSVADKASAEEPTDEIERIPREKKEPKRQPKTEPTSDSKSPAPTAPTRDLSATYGATGVNADGLTYVGTTELQKIGGEMYRVTWTVGATTLYGRGFRDGDVLSVGWSNRPQVGVYAYLVGEGGSLDGVWFGGGDVTLGHETLTGGPELGGVYQVKSARTPAKIGYSGSVVISPSDELFSLKYTLGSRSFTGLGVLQGKVLAVGYSEVGGEYGVAVYRIVDGGETLAGRWASSTQKSKELGIETLRKKK